MRVGALVAPRGWRERRKSAARAVKRNDHRGGGAGLTGGCGKDSRGGERGWSGERNEYESNWFSFTGRHYFPLLPSWPTPFAFLTPRYLFTGHHISWGTRKRRHVSCSGIRHPLSLIRFSRFLFRSLLSWSFRDTERTLLSIENSWHRYHKDNYERGISRFLIGIPRETPYRPVRRARSMLKWAITILHHWCGISKVYGAKISPEMFMGIHLRFNAWKLSIG